MYIYRTFVPSTNSSASAPSSKMNIPIITLTPPTEPPAPSERIPQQNLGKTQLYVPIKTEEIGWEAGGLFWSSRYAYPTLGIYGGGIANDQIGTYRGGPEGYRFESYWDAHERAADLQRRQTRRIHHSFAEPLPQSPSTAAAEGIVVVEQIESPPSSADVSTTPTSSLEENDDDKDSDDEPYYDYEDDDDLSDAGSAISDFSSGSASSDASRRSSNSSVSTVAGDTEEVELAKGGSNDGSCSAAIIAESGTMHQLASGIPPALAVQAG